MRLYTYPYSNEYVPAMPVVELGVSRPGSRHSDQIVAAVIDSGADGTLLPVNVLEAVGAGNALQFLTVTLNGPAGVTEINA